MTQILRIRYPIFAPDSDINKINERLDGIEDNQIKTINQHNASLPELEKADKHLKDLIEALQGKAGELAKDIEKNAGRIDEVLTDNGIRDFVTIIRE